MKISIGTLSKAFELSDEALRFYEKKGLLHPRRENRNGYRVFSRADIQRVSNIQRLKNQGFSLEETHSVYSGIGQEEFVRLYEQKIRQAELEIAYRQAVLAHMQEAAETLRNAPALLEKPQILPIEPVYILEYPSIEEMWRVLPDEPLLKSLFRQLPLSSFTTIIRKEALDGGECRIQKGILVFETDAEILGLERGAFRKISAPQAAVCLFRLENGVFDVPRLLALLNQFLQQHQLRASDDLFTAQLASFVNEQDNAIHYSRMIVPLQPVSG